MNLEKYRGLVDQSSNTMKSTDLHEFVFETTGKFKELKHFHEKIKSVLDIEGLKFRPTLRANGQVEFYNLDEVECNMIMASIDVSHLRLIAEVFVAVKGLLEENKLHLEIGKLKTEEALLQEEIVDKRVNRVKLLQSMGVNFDPIAMIDSGRTKSVLNEEMSEALSDAYSDIRTGIKVFSATSLLAENEIDIRTKDFNDAMIQAGKMERYFYNNKPYKRFVDPVNYYGYNRDASSVKVNPQQVCYYEDRFANLVTLLKNEGYID